MSETAADLRDRLLPKAPYRQWVLSFPWPMRFALAYDRVFLSKMLSAFLRTVFAWQRRRGRSLGIADGQTGAVTFVQRMGGALNLNPHAHSLLPDGLWVSGPEGGACRSVDPHFADGHPADHPSGDRLVFVQLPPPTDAEIQQLTERVARRLVKVARRYVTVHLEQLLEVDGQPAVENEQASMHNALRASLRAPVRFAPPAPSPSVADAGGTPCLPGVNVEANAAVTSAPSPTAVTAEHRGLCASVQGFSLHAATAVSEDDRDGLERLCRYGLRAPFSLKRFSLLADGRVRYGLRRPWPHAAGATELTLEPLDVLRRLAALIPWPYTNLVRYHGVFANRSRYRDRLPAASLSSSSSVVSAVGIAPDTAQDRAQDRAGDKSAGLAGVEVQSCVPRRKRRVMWAQLLRRVFHVDALRCPKCSSGLVVLAFLTDPEVVRKILLHLRLPASAPPVSRSRVEGLSDQRDLFGEVAEEWDDRDPRFDEESGNGHFFQDNAPVRGARGPP